MSGLNRLSGAALDPRSDAHLEQSFGDILTTPLASRPMRREYGSEVPELVDQPMNPLFRIRIFAASAAAIMAWEPRAVLKRVVLVTDALGAAAIRLQGFRTDLPRARPFDFLIPVRPA